ERMPRPRPGAPEASRRRRAAVAKNEPRQSLHERVLRARSAALRRRTAGTARTAAYQTYRETATNPAMSEKARRGRARKNSTARTEAMLADILQAKPTKGGHAWRRRRTSLR